MFDSRGDDGGEYAGGSRRPEGNGEGLVEIWQKGPKDDLSTSASFQR